MFALLYAPALAETLDYSPACEALMKGSDYETAKWECYHLFNNNPFTEERPLGDLYYSALAWCKLDNPKGMLKRLHELYRKADERLAWAEWFGVVADDRCFQRFYRQGVSRFLADHRPGRWEEERQSGNFYERNSRHTVRKTMPWEHSGLSWTDEGFGGEFALRLRQRYKDCFHFLSSCGYSNALAIGRDVWGENLYAEYQHRAHLLLDWGIGVGAYETDSKAVSFSDDSEYR